MKGKIFLGVLISIGVLFYSSVSYSASVEIPSAEKGKPEIKLGLNSFKRKMRYDSGEISPTSKTGKIESDQYFIRCKYGILDKLEIYADYGSANMFFDYDNTTYKKEWGREDFWGVGLAGILFKAENGVKIGFDMHYATGEQGVKNLEGLGSSVVFSGDVKWKEWHAALFVSKQFKFLEPFVGVKYSDFHQHHDTTIFITGAGGGFGVIEGLDYKSEDNVGIFVGTKFNFKESFSFTVQGRFLDEKSIGCSLGYKF